MNSYRVIFKTNNGNRRRRFDVDAMSPVTAIRRALSAFESVSTVDVDVDMSCRLFATNVLRDSPSPKVRAV